MSRYIRCVSTILPAPTRPGANPPFQVIRSLCLGARYSRILLLNKDARCCEALS